jgi:hypothetical protein
LFQPDKSITDQNGVARATWFRAKGADVVTVVADVRSGAASGTAYIRLNPEAPNPANARDIELIARKGFQQSWFEKSQLPQMVMVELSDLPSGGKAPSVGDAASCASNRVVFKPRGAPAAVSPDTATAYSVGAQCYAWTFWSLGEGIGERRLAVNLVPGKNFKATNDLLASSWARATPKFVAGFALSRLRSYTAFSDASQRIVHVERIDASGAKHSYDTTETTGVPGKKDVPSAVEGSAIAGISVPIPVAKWGDWDDLSITAGVDLSNPKNRIYAGLSILRLFGRINPVIESLPIDVHLLGFWARQPELKDGRCDAYSCVEEKRLRFQGPSFMISADATSLISELVKKLAP